MIRNMFVRDTQNDNSMDLVHMENNKSVLISTCNTFNSVRKNGIMYNTIDCDLMHFSATGGSMAYSNIGRLNLLIQILVHCNLDSFANILSFFIRKKVLHYRGQQCSRSNHGAYR